MKDIKVLIFVTVTLFAFAACVNAQAKPDCPDGKCPLVKTSGKAVVQHAQPQLMPVANGPVAVRLRHMPILVAAVQRVASLPVRVCCRLRCCR